jgi:hypothetical protein
MNILRRIWWGNAAPDEPKSTPWQIVRFTPQEDITPYELACILSVIDGNLSRPIRKLRDTDLDPRIARHFTEHWGDFTLLG